MVKIGNSCIGLFNLKNLDLGFESILHGSQIEFIFGGLLNLV
jgi:hypothetical protein